MRFKANLVYLLYALVILNIILVAIYLWPKSLSFVGIRRTAAPKRLFYLTGDPVPLGVKLRYSIAQGEERTRFNVSGFIVEEPEVKGQDVYLTIALDYDSRRGYQKKLPVYLGKLDDKIGVNVAEGGRESNVYKTARIKDIYPRLQRDTQALLVITTSISESVLYKPECQDNPKCKKIVEYINSYGREIEPYLYQLSEGKFSMPPKPLGIVSQIVFIR